MFLRTVMKIIEDERHFSLKIVATKVENTRIRQRTNVSSQSNEGEEISI